MPSSTIPSEQQPPPSPSQAERTAPSPPPQQPTPVTPGPRATAFIKLYDNALSHTLRAISYDSFAACFPSIARTAPESLKAMHQGLVGRLEGFAKDEFETILMERNVIQNLNALEDLIADAKRRKARARGDEEVIAPHLLPAPAILNAHLSPLLVSQQSQLNAKLQTVQSQNASLAEKLVSQRKEIETLLSNVENVVRDLDGAVELLEREGVQLAKDAVGAEQTMEGI
ncbi:Nnf1-domain-containing protein [Xylogone sp. PMI_703]|nr:Nnf1-domain-containing protein [Xylogone sp. PMI_703]